VEGGTGELVVSIKAGEWQDAPGLTARDIALCTVAEKMSGNPTKMTEEDWKPLRDLGFDDAGCLEVGHIVGIFNYLTRMADGFGLILDEGTQKAGEMGVALERAPTE
jgi:alkylhydroperoxidase family enzyme